MKKELLIKAAKKRLNAEMARRGYENNGRAMFWKKTEDDVYYTFRLSESRAGFTLLLGFWVAELWSVFEPNSNEHFDPQKHMRFTPILVDCSLREDGRIDYGGNGWNVFNDDDEKDIDEVLRIYEGIIQILDSVIEPWFIRYGRRYIFSEMLEAGSEHYAPKARTADIIMKKISPEIARLQRLEALNA